ncbi:No_hits_found [Rivularia sp. IAM M-261]|nr:No_hits_found [Calothrix sp. PCC 7716]GJD16774.1 No_hits_found [Rivularia sp. IAM M-261]
MAKRTSDNDVQTWDDAQDLDSIVVDKRAHKRANGAKRRRRNRRYENRLLNSQLENY